ncbi:hypothetical protein TSUD_24840 [Trifolium subterraneum]|uniref:F-box domain-containing protein n=1 Tax=Trifolium subterraneum TaxID=3900 RepID=A0A2Z6LTS0_TRISU|nr:hypothetical protein TSUD_24840 [Trifolium subterraneum]
MDETTAVKSLGGNSLHSSLPSSTYIPLDTIQETILCRLPVKSLLRFRCICKPWDSLISKDFKFAKKHLRVSPKRQHLITTTLREAEELTVMCCPFDTLNLHSNFNSKSTQLDYSPIISKYHDGLIASCDGILCFDIDQCLASYKYNMGTFIHDHVEVHSYTLGTDTWKRIKDFPSMFRLDEVMSKHGIFMRGTVNWLALSDQSFENLDAIVSLHLGKESYQEISLPELSPYFNGHSKMLTLYVMRDCLCLFEIYKERSYKSDSFTDVWLMKEYGNKDSWIKLFRLPCFGKYAFQTDIVYISEDDDNQVLLVFKANHKFKWVVYDLKNDTITVMRSKAQDNLRCGKVKSPR